MRPGFDPKLTVPTPQVCRWVLTIQRGVHPTHMHTHMHTRTHTHTPHTRIHTHTRTHAHTRTHTHTHTHTHTRYEAFLTSRPARPLHPWIPPALTPTRRSLLDLTLDPPPRHDSADLTLSSSAPEAATATWRRNRQFGQDQHLWFSTDAESDSPFVVRGVSEGHFTLPASYVTLRRASRVTST